MQTVLEIAERQARAADATQIHGLSLRVGQLTAIAPEALEHAFAVLRQGTLAQHAQLAVEYVPAAYWCASCQEEFEAQDLTSECPRCGAASRDVRRGRELQLLFLEVD